MTGRIRGRLEVCLLMYLLRSTRIFSLITPQSEFSSELDSATVFIRTSRAPTSSSWPFSLMSPRVTISGCDSRDRKSTRLNSSHLVISYAAFCLKKKNRSPLIEEALSTACRRSWRRRSLGSALHNHSQPGTSGVVHHRPCLIVDHSSNAVRISVL